MGAEPGWDRLIRGLRAGDDEVVAEFCAAYGPALHQIAARHISPGLRRRVGPESVVQSACWSFLRRAREGQFQLGESEDLWRLLCAITMSKVRKRAQFHLRLKRGVDREIPLQSGDGAGEAVAPGPSPDEAAAIAEQFERVVDALDEEEREVIELKLRGLTNLEIADHMRCSERTVRRHLIRIRDRLERTLEVA